MFLPEISNQMVSVNGKHPLSFYRVGETQVEVCYNSKELGKHSPVGSHYPKLSQVFPLNNYIMSLRFLSHDS